tara:strand:- start:21007 stop:21174 length:168 start_codon:yes stop_codon:yes gene_type:complete
MAMCYGFGRSVGGEADTEFLGFNLFRAPDAHKYLLLDCDVVAESFTRFWGDIVPK